MRVFGISNVKGGVGKTATAVNLAWLASRAGVRTLLWDLDPQGAASFYFRVRPKSRTGGRKVVRGKREVTDLVRGSDWSGLDLVPSDPSYRSIDLELDAQKKSRRRLALALAPLADEYDLVVLDCAPGLSLVHENVFEAADVLLTPTIPSTLSLRTLAQLMQHLAEHKRRHLRVLPFLSMVDRRKRLHRETCEWVRAHPLGFLETEIPYASVVERMGVERAPVCAFAPASHAARAFESLWHEVQRRTGGYRRRDETG